MVRLEVVAYGGRSPTLGLAAEFDELGGTIGRDCACTLILPDPEKRISRRHGVVALAGGRYVLRDHGSALPIRHNGRNVGAGGEVVLAAGDQIDIGAYTLRVSFPRGAASGPGSEPAASLSTAADDVQAPLVRGGARRDPFADLAPESKPNSAAPSAAVRDAGVIPADFDPFAAPLLPPATAATAESSPRDPFGLGIAAPGPTESIDALFALRSGDPFPPGHPLSVPASGGGSPSVDDVLAQPRRLTTGPTQRDDAAELHGTMKLPETARGERAGAVPSCGNDDAGESLAAAFAQGAGVPSLPVREVTPELMRALGELLRVALEGTLDLLRARTAAKGELRAGMTVIAPVENNPLKFSPTVEAALTHLLAPQAPGFMAPRRALEEAYRDLVAHQLGLAAGTRAALAEALSRFDPAALEARLAEDRSLLDPLVPSLRRARLWDLYAARFAELSGEAEQGFERAFAGELVAAYEAQVARLVRR